MSATAQTSAGPFARALVRFTENRAALVGLVLGLVIQVIFGGLLGLSLPPGPLLEGVPFLRG